MQPRVMNHCFISSKNCRLHRRMPCGTYLKFSSTSSACSVSENRTNGFLQLGFEIFENRYNLFNSLLVDHTLRSIDKQTEIFVKFDFRWKVHHSSTGDPLLIWLLGSRGLSASRFRGTASHLAASSRF